MPRVDPSITKAAIRMVAKTREASLGAEEGLTNWEGEFLDSLEERLHQYGSAFNDPDLGAMCGALSLRQGLKLKQIKRKAKSADTLPPKKPLVAKTRKPIKPTKSMKRTPFNRKTIKPKFSGKHLQVPDDGN